MIALIRSKYYKVIWAVSRYTSLTFPHIKASRNTKVIYINLLNYKHHHVPKESTCC